MRYMLTIEQMMENDYPIPSYMADVFEKSLDWVETPQPDGETSTDGKCPRVLAMDCEMVCAASVERPALSLRVTHHLVSDRGWQGTCTCMSN